MTGAMGTWMYDSGVLYYARGKGWVREAIVSATSAREAMPACPAAIFCSEPLPPGHFEFAAVVAPAWRVPESSQGSEIDGIPVCFPKINGGVLAFRRTPTAGCRTRMESRER